MTEPNGPNLVLNPVFLATAEARAETVVIPELPEGFSVVAPEVVVVANDDGTLAITDEIPPEAPKDAVPLDAAPVEALP